jgi:cytochrome c oxidase subunit III
MSDTLATSSPVRGTDVFADVSPEVKVRTKKMLMWFIIFAVVMLFGGITSAIIVLNGKLMWVQITPPMALWISVVLVALSSATMYLAVRALKKGQTSSATIFTATTLAFGIGFVVSQNSGWNALAGKGMGYTVTLTDEGTQKYSWNTLGRISGEYGKDFYFQWKGEKLVQENGEFFAPSDEAREKPLTNQVKTTFNAAGAMLSVLIYVHIIHLAFGLIYLAANVVRLYRGILSADNWISLYSSGMYWHFMGLLWVYLFFFIFYIY